MVRRVRGEVFVVPAKDARLLSARNTQTLKSRVERIFFFKVLARNLTRGYND